MKRIFPLFVLLAGQALAAENAVPTAYNADRYAAMIEKSPFALATPPAPLVAAAQPSFAANWYLTGAGRDDEGHDFVTIAAQDQSVHFTLSANEAHDEVSLASVSWAEGYKKTTAIIKKGTETAKLEFSQTEAAPVAEGVPMPGARPGGFGRPGGATAMKPQTPVVNPGGGGAPVTLAQPRSISLPRPTGAPAVTAPVVQQPRQQQVPGGGNQQGAAGAENRRRTRNIAAPQ